MSETVCHLTKQTPKLENDFPVNSSVFPSAEPKFRCGDLGFNKLGFNILQLFCHDILFFANTYLFKNVDSNILLFNTVGSVADPGFGQGGAPEIFYEILPT